MLGVWLVYSKIRLGYKIKKCIYRLEKSVGEFSCGGRFLWYGIAQHSDTLEYSPVDSH